MSYRLIDANAIAALWPEVNDMPCIYADLSSGLDGGHYDMRESDELQRENAKLRELCADMWHDIPKTESCGWDMSTNTCTGSDECIGECSYWCRMRDLGIEAKRCKRSW